EGRDENNRAADGDAFPIAQQADLCQQTGEGEEEREEESGAEAFEAFAQMQPKLRLGRHDGAGEKGAEQGVDTDNLGKQSGGKDEDEDADDHAARGAGGSSGFPSERAVQ